MTLSAKFADLEGASVLITGGGSGIGAALTDGFARQGAKVAFIDIAEDASKALCDRLTGTVARRPLFLKCDIRDIDALRAAVGRAAEAHGQGACADPCCRILHADTPGGDECHVREGSSKLRKIARTNC